MSTIKKLMALPVAFAMLATFGATAASAQVAVRPVVAIELLSNGLTSPLVAGQDATIGRLVLDTTGSSESVRISSLPFRLTTGGGAAASSLDNCRVFNESNSNVVLNTNASTTIGLVNGLNTVSFDSPIVLAPNTVTTLDVRCTPDTSLINGGTYTLSMNTADVAGTGVSSGLPALVTIRGAVVIPPVVVIPGVPNTGAGGNATQNILMILGSALLASLGIVYTKRLAR